MDGTESHKERLALFRKDMVTDPNVPSWNRAPAKRVRSSSDFTTLDEADDKTPLESDKPEPHSISTMFPFSNSPDLTDARTMPLSLDSTVLINPRTNSVPGQIQSPTSGVQDAELTGQLATMAPRQLLSVEENVKSEASDTQTVLNVDNDHQVVTEAEFSEAKLLWNKLAPGTQESVIKALMEIAKYKEPSSVQSLVWEIYKGTNNAQLHDLILLAPMSAGKTWAYLLPVIDKVLKIQEIQKKYHPKMHHGRKVYLVILVPSRLLGLQIMMELKSIEKHTGITSLLSHREKNNTPRLTMEQIKAGLANILITNLGRLQNLLTMDITEQSQVTKTLMKDDVRQDLLEEIFSQSMFASVKQVVLEEVGDLVGREAEVDTIKNLLARCQSDVKIVACSALRCESPRLQELLMSASPFPPPVHHVQQQYDGKDAMSLLDIDFTFKCVQDVKKSGVQWDYKFNQLQEIILKEDERTLIVSDSIEITEKSEQWISKISSNMKTALFHGNLPQEKFAANFQRFIIDETANIGCSTSKMTAGLNFNVDHVIIAELGKPRFLENEINTAMTNIGRTGRNKRKGRVTIIFNHHDKEIGEHLCAKLLEYFPDDSDLKAEVEKITRFFQIDIMQLLKDTFKNPAMPEDADNTWVVGESVNNPLDGVADVEGTGEKGDAEDDDDDDDDARFIAEQNAEEAAVGQDAEEAAVVQDAEEAAVGQNAEEAAVDAAAQAPPGGW